MTRMAMLLLALVSLIGMDGRVAAQSFAAAPLGRVTLHAHNCFPEEGRWSDRLDRALATQRQAVGLAPAQPVLRLNLARFLIKAGRREDALGELDKLAALGPGFNRQAEVQRMRKDLGA